MWRRRVECLGLGVAVESEAPPPPALIALLSTFAPATDVALRYRVVAGPPARLERDGEPIATLGSWDDATPLLELDLYGRLAERAEGWLVHAAAMIGPGGALVLAGHSGAGKSTLVHALLARGLGYLTEEAVLFAAGACRGLCRPLNVSDAALPDPPGAASTDYPLVRADGVRVALRLVAPAAAALRHGPARPRALIRLRHDADATGALAPLDGGTALRELWPMTMNPGHAALAAACEALAAVPAFDLHTRTPAEALARVVELARRLGVAP